MADKKGTQLNPAGVLTANDLAFTIQNMVSGEMLQTTWADVRTFVLGGANAGARIYFPVGVPDPLLGVNEDVAFDVQNHNVYQKTGGAWVLKDSYGAIGGMGRIRFTSAYGSDGLSVDGLTYTNADLIGNIVQSVTVDATPLIAMEEFGVGVPAFDEFDFDTDTGAITFGAALPAGFRITVLYSI